MARFAHRRQGRGNHRWRFRPAPSHAAGPPWPAHSGTQRPGSRFFSGVHGADGSAANQCVNNRGGPSHRSRRSPPCPRFLAHRPHHEHHIRGLDTSRQPPQARTQGMKLAQLLQKTLGLFAAIVLFLMMTITAVDVVGRYFFNKPLAGGFEITEIGLALLIYCACSDRWAYPTACFKDVKPLSVNSCFNSL